MTWWNKKSKPEDLPEIIQSTGKPGEIIPCNNPLTAIILPPPDPEPNLSTKPADIVGYCFGYVCPKRHVGETFESITVDGYKERRACNTCGAVAKPAVVKQTSEARWIDTNQYLSCFGPDWEWRHNFLVPGFSPANMMINWTSYEFVHYLDTPKPSRKATPSPYDLVGVHKGARNETAVDRTRRKK